MIDTHCHISSLKYKSLRPQIMKTFKQAGGDFMIDIATTLENVHSVVQTYAEYPHLVKIALGLHPENLFRIPSKEKPKKTDEDQHKIGSSKKEINRYVDHSKVFFKKLQKWMIIVESAINLKKVVAIGETGFDTYYFSELQTFEQQEYIVSQQARLFKHHVRLAQKYNLPLIIHHRGELFDTFAILLKILQEYNFIQPVIFHSFAGNKTDLQQLQALDYYIGYNGIITYSGTSEMREVLKLVPRERLLLETDSPYLTPANIAIDRRLPEKLNQPTNVLAVARMLASIMLISPEEILEITTSNALRIFS